MKKKLLLVVLVMLSGVLLFTGCGEKKEKKNSIEGKWAYSSFVYNFESDGTGYYDAAGTKMDFTYEIKDNKLSILYKGSTAPFETEFSIDGDTLTVKDSFGKDFKYVRR